LENNKKIVRKLLENQLLTQFNLPPAYIQNPLIPFWKNLANDQVYRRSNLLPWFRLKRPDTLSRSNITASGPAPLNPGATALSIHSLI
jgi:hypothetical protein